MTGSLSLASQHPTKEPGSSLRCPCCPFLLRWSLHESCPAVRSRTRARAGRRPPPPRRRPPPLAAAAAAAAAAARKHQPRRQDVDLTARARTRPRALAPRPAAAADERCCPKGTTEDGSFPSPEHRRSSAQPAPEGARSSRGRHSPSEAHHTLGHAQVAPSLVEISSFSAAACHGCRSAPSSTYAVGGSEPPRILLPSRLADAARHPDRASLPSWLLVFS